MGREESLEKPISLNEQRLGMVAAALKATGAKRVVDLGCGEGKLLRELLKEKQFEEIVGMDVAFRSLEIAKDRLRLDDLPASATKPHPAPAWFADVSGQTICRFRCGSGGGGRRASRSAPLGRL